MRSIETVHAELERVMRLRDEIKDRIDLGEADIPEWWDELERKWDEVSTKMIALGSASDAGSASAMAARAHALLSEIRENYEFLDVA